MGEPIPFQQQLPLDLPDARQIVSWLRSARHPEDIRNIAINAVMLYEAHQRAMEKQLTQALAHLEEAHSFLSGLSDGASL